MPPYNPRSTANPQPDDEDAPGPRPHEDTWGANPEAKRKFTPDSPTSAKTSPEAEKK